LAGERFGSKLHHRDVVGVALRRLEKDLAGPERENVLEDMKNELRKEAVDSNWSRDVMDTQI
jgi:Arc/MetJ family transcription regulator